MTDAVWTVKAALDWTVEYLGRKAVENPRRSAEWLLSAATGLSRVELYAHHDRALTASERATYRASIERRAAGEPLQYVTGEMPFRHLVLHVRPGVFIPRPETEVVVDEALAALPAPVVGGSAQGPVVVDLCTGSGAVAVSIAHERADARVYATEAASDAAECARENARRCGVDERLTVFEGDLFGPLPAGLRGTVDVVTANPPYIPTGDLAGLPAEVGDHEPREALDGGADGLDVVRRIVADAREWLAPGGTLVIECDTSTTKDAARLMSAWYEGSRVVCDLTGRDRVATGRTRKD
jgi:release factor glutamine methyltransferase